MGPSTWTIDRHCGTPRAADEIPNSDRLAPFAALCDTGQSRMLAHAVTTVHNVA
jgi:hypothetical protein